MFTIPGFNNVSNNSSSGGGQTVLNPISKPTSFDNPALININISDPSGVNATTVTSSSFLTRRQNTTNTTPLEVISLTPSNLNFMPAVLQWQNAVSDTLTPADNGVWELLVVGLSDLKTPTPNSYTTSTVVGTFEVDIPVTVDPNLPNLGVGSDPNTTYFGGNLTELPVGWKSGISPIEFLNIGVKINPGNRAGLAYIESPRLTFTDTTVLTVNWLAAAQNSQVTIQGEPLFIEPQHASIWSDDGITSTSELAKPVQVVFTRSGNNITEVISHDANGDGVYTQVSTNTYALGEAAFANFHLYIDAVSETMILQNIKLVN